MATHIEVQNQAPSTEHIPVHFTTERPPLEVSVEQYERELAELTPGTLSYEVKEATLDLLKRQLSQQALTGLVQEYLGESPPTSR